MTTTRPNILLLFTDQQRADALGCAEPLSGAGRSAARTPSLDRLAAEGVRFTHAVTPQPICIAARYSLITGLRSRHHGWTQNVRLPLPAVELPTIMTVLGEAGYHTRGVGKFHFQPSRRHHGFHRMELMEEVPRHREDDEYLMYLRRVGYGHKREVHGVRNLLYQQPQTSSIPEEHVGSTWVADRAVEFLRGYRRTEPFFLWASWIAPHPPWNVPPPFDSMHRIEDMPLPFDYDKPADELPVLARMLRSLANTENATEARLRRITALYLAQCSLVDKGVGRILAELERKGLAEDTLVIFASDHGEMLNDHGLCQKCLPYDSCCRIPLILRWPSRLKAGRVTDDYATLLDLMPTCLDAAGLRYPGPLSLAGRSLLGGEPSRDEVVVEFDHAPHRWVSIRDRSFKFNVWHEEGFQELYDLREDPLECRNLARQLPDVAAHYYRRLVAWEKEHGLGRLPAPLGSLEGDRFRVFPAREVEWPYRCRQFPTWARNLPPDELERMETPGETVMNAISGETSYTLDELDLKTWKAAGGNLEGTPYEEVWRKS